MTDMFSGIFNSTVNSIHNRQAAQALAGNDYAGAMSNLARVGNLQGVNNLRTQQRSEQAAEQAAQQEQSARSVAFARQATRAIGKTMQDGGDPLATFDQIAPAMQSLGATPEQINGYRQQLAQNPQGFLQGINSVLDSEEQKLSFQKAGDRLLVFNEGSPDPIRQYDAPARPIVSGGVAFDPQTGAVITDARRPDRVTVEGGDGASEILEFGADGNPRSVYRGSPAPRSRILSAQEVQSLGLPAGSYQQNADGEIKAINAPSGDRATLSATQQRQVEAYHQELATLDSVDAELDRFDNMIANGELNLSPTSNFIGGIRNATNTSSQNSRNLSEFQSTLERIRNDSLRLNKGTQTEGDAQRAWNELVANISDERVVRQQLARIKALNARARQFRQGRIGALEGGGAPSGGTGGRRPANLGTREVPYNLNPNSPTQSYNNVPSGAHYRAPDGSVRIKG